jgi:hypothetical protein
MKKKTLLSTALVATFCLALQTRSSFADGHEVIEKVMKDYHKAPEGTDPLCKKVGAGAATEEELAKLLAGYREMAKCEPPKGAKSSWETKNKALIDAVIAIQKKDPAGVSAYKQAVNCKNCHSAHKPD